LEEIRGRKGKYIKREREVFGRDQRK
jgi:hypothetical protein